MKLKTLSLLALAAALAIVFAGCAQDSTDISDDNPNMQEQVMKGATGQAAAGDTGAAGTDTTRAPATGGTKGTKVAISADPAGTLKFNTSKLNAKPGEVTIAFTNKSDTPHDVTIADDKNKVLGKTEEISAKSTTAQVKVDKPGTYSFYCSVPGHRQAGMEGTLTVR
jgi:plastocyanin